MNVTDVREGLADAVAVSGLRVYPRVPDTLNPPAAIVFVPDGDYDLDMSGGMTLNLPVVVIVSRAAGDDAANRELDKRLNPTGAESVAAAVHADPTLGGVCDDAVVTGFTDYGGTFAAAGVDYASVTLNIRVIG